MIRIFKSLTPRFLQNTNHLFPIQMPFSRNTPPFQIVKSSLFLKLSSAFSTNQKQPISEEFLSQSKDFYNHFVENIIQLEKTEDWENIVSSVRQPIVVDCYADWCEPCKILTPKLQAKAKEAAGKHKLLKINIDKHQSLAQAFQIKSVPTIFVVFMGKPFSKAEGVMNEKQLSDYYRVVDSITKAVELEQIANQQLEVIKIHMSKNQYAEAELKLNKFDPTHLYEDYKALKYLFLAFVQSEQKNYSDFKSSLTQCQKYVKFLEQMPELNELYINLQKAYSKLEAEAQKTTGILGLKTQIDKIQKENGSCQQILQLKHQLLLAYKEEKLVQSSLEVAMEMIKKDKKWKDGQIQKFILSVFQELGNASPITQKYRKIYQRLLY